MNKWTTPNACVRAAHISCQRAAVDATAAAERAAAKARRMAALAVEHIDSKAASTAAIKLAVYAEEAMRAAKHALCIAAGLSEIGVTNEHARISVLHCRSLAKGADGIGALPAHQAEDVAKWLASANRACLQATTYANIIADSAPTLPRGIVLADDMDGRQGPASRADLAEQILLERQNFLRSVGVRI